MAEPLTRETRYEGLWLLHPYHPDCSIAEEPAPFTLCRSCGSLVLVGSEDQHEYMHPLASCNTVHPGCDINCNGSHPWESQFVTWTTLGSPHATP